MFDQNVFMAILVYKKLTYFVILERKNITNLMLTWISLSSGEEFLNMIDTKHTYFCCDFISFYFLGKILLWFHDQIRGLLFKLLIVFFSIINLFYTKHIKYIEREEIAQQIALVGGRMQDLQAAFVYDSSCLRHCLGLRFYL